MLARSLIDLARFVEALLIIAVEIGQADARSFGVGHLVVEHVPETETHDRPKWIKARYVHDAL